MPSVQIQGNWHIVLETGEAIIQSVGSQKIKLIVKLVWGQPVECEEYVRIQNEHGVAMSCLNKWVYRR